MLGTDIPSLPVQGHGLPCSAPPWSAGASGPWTRTRDRKSLAGGCWRDGLGAWCSARWGSPGWVGGRRRGQVQDAGGEALVSPGVRACRRPSCAGTRSGQGVVQSPPSLTGHLLIRIRHEGGRSHPDLPSPELCLPSTSPMRPVLPGGNGGVWRAQRGWGASGGGGTELGGSGRRDCLRAPPASLGRPG